MTLATTQDKQKNGESSFLLIKMNKERQTDSEWIFERCARTRDGLGFHVKTEYAVFVK